MIIQCPYCQKKYKTRTENEGKECVCKNCHHRFTMTSLRIAPHEVICEHCGTAIGQSEQACVYNGKIVCMNCDERLRPSATAASVGQPAHTGPDVSDSSAVADKTAPNPNKISSLLLYSYVLFTLFAALIPFLPQTPLFQLLRKSGGLIVILSWILPFVLLHRLWAALQIGLARTTAAKAVGFLLIPVFGFYWAFQAFWGWAKDFNKTLAERDITEPRMSELLALLASFTPFLTGVVLCLQFLIGGIVGSQAGQSQIEQGVLSMYLICLLALLAYIVCVDILFFWTARDCANFIVDKFSCGDLIVSENRKLEIDCPECRRPLKGAVERMIGDTGVCPKCGAEFGIYEGKTPNLAIASLILSLYPILNVLGLLAGIISVFKIKRAKRLCGYRLALAGILLSSVTILIVLAEAAPSFWIGRQKAQQIRVTNTRATLRLLHSAVNQFKMDTGRYPTEDEGLMALIEQPTDVINWEPGGYLETTELPPDGWGNEFVYILRPDRSRAFVIKSLGADGRDSGQGWNADLLSTDRDDWRY